MTKKLQPKLRFRGFTDAWEQREFSSIFGFLKTNSYSRASLESRSTGIVDIHYGDILVNYDCCLLIDGHTLPTLKDPSLADAYRNDQLMDGDIVIADTAEDQTAGRCVELFDVGSRRVLAGLHTIAIRSTIKFGAGYLGYYLSSPAYRKQLIPQMQGTKVISISKTSLKNTSIASPQPVEQIAIGALLRKLDALIAAEKRKLSLLEKKKEAYSRIVFADSRNHKQNDEKWKIVRLGDVATRITRRNFGQSNLPLTISARDGLIDQREYFNKQVASKNLNDYTLLRQGEFAYNKSTSSDSPWGTIKRLDKYDQGCVSTLYICFSIHDIDSQFLTALFDSSQWHSEIQAVATEGARNHGLLNVSASDFFNMRMRIPVLLSEQEHIGKFFATFKELTQRVSRKIELLELRKKALLQHMFI